MPAYIETQAKRKALKILLIRHSKSVTQTNLRGLSKRIPAQIKLSERHLAMIVRTNVVQPKPVGRPRISKSPDPNRRRGAVADAIESTSADEGINRGAIPPRRFSLPRNALGIQISAYTSAIKRVIGRAAKTASLDHISSDETRR